LRGVFTINNVEEERKKRERRNGNGNGKKHSSIEIGLVMIGQ